MIGRTAFIALAVGVYFLGGCATVPEPAHKVMSKNGGYEVREYAGYLLAETTVSGPWKEALNEGSSKVAMTAPVLSG